MEFPFKWLNSWTLQNVSKIMPITDLPIFLLPWIKVIDLQIKAIDLQKLNTKQAMQGCDEHMYKLAHMIIWTFLNQYNYPWWKLYIWIYSASEDITYTQPLLGLCLSASAYWPPPSASSWPLLLSLGLSDLLKQRGRSYEQEAERVRPRWLREAERKRWEKEAKRKRKRRGQICLFREAHRKWVSHVISVSQSETLSESNSRLHLLGPFAASSWPLHFGHSHSFLASQPLPLSLFLASASQCQPLGLLLASASSPRPLDLCFSVSASWPLLGRCLLTWASFWPLLLFLLLASVSQPLPLRFVQQKAENKRLRGWGKEYSEALKLIGWGREEAENRPRG